MENIKKNINLVLNILLLLCIDYFFLFFKNYSTKDSIEIINHEILFEKKQKEVFKKNPIVLTFYTLSEEDTLETILIRFPKGADVLFLNNPFLEKGLKAGEKILIFNDNYTYYKIKEEDTFLKVVSEFKLSSAEILRLNELKDYNINGKKKLLIKFPELEQDGKFYRNFYYNSKYVETVESLAQRLNVSPSDIKKVNQIDSSLLFREQLLILRFPLK